MLKRFFIILAFALTGFIPIPTHAAGRAKQVVVVVWDGMRPDFVTPELTPNAWRLAAGGVTFANHHPVYMSATEVNGTAIATGMYPEHSGIIANKEYRPAIDTNTLLHMEIKKFVRKGDEVSGGHYLRTPTTAEILRRNGLPTLIAGAKGVALLHDRAIKPPGDKNITLFAGESEPEAVAKELIASQGPFPEEFGKAPSRIDWTVQALLERLWKDRVPAFTLVWMHEPDASQHQWGLGSPEALAALKNADDNLGRILQALEEKGIADQTDVMLVSDHGFSTVGARLDPAAELRKAGFPASAKPDGKPTKGAIVVASNGGSCLYYVAEHDRGTISRLVTFLQQQDCSGVLFTREPMEGTFSLADAKINSPDAPDVVLSMAWSSNKNSNGVPGILTSGVYDYGEVGMHVSLSRYDMHNTLLAAGPDFRKGVVDHLPTGNTDVAPTALWILGVKPPKPMDGRVLSEALNFKGPPLKSYEPRRLEASRNLDGKVWRQYLNFSEVNGVVYLDEGNRL